MHFHHETHLSRVSLINIRMPTFTIAAAAAVVVIIIIIIISNNTATASRKTKRTMVARMGKKEVK